MEKINGCLKLTVYNQTYFYDVKEDYTNIPSLQYFHEKV